MQQLRHIAFIMDGNGRWAKLRGKPRNYGHRQGLKTVEKVLEWTVSAGIPYISLYVFSTENWKRSKVEVDGLFSLAEQYLSNFRKFCENRIRVVVSGSRSGLPSKLLKSIDEVVENTRNCTQLTCNLCINYGGRQEIADALKRVAEGGDFSVENICRNMYNELPDPDLIVRTGGHKRLSNFLLFQSAYAELNFTDTLWPDFSLDEYNEIIRQYMGTERNFGGVNNQ